MAIPVFAGLISELPKLIELLYLPIFKGAGEIAAISIVGVWIFILGQMYGTILLAQGRPQPMAIGNGVTIVAFCLMVSYFFTTWGMCIPPFAECAF